jgi:hypothetical protein
VFEAQLAEVELALVDTAQQFDASDGDRRGSEPLEAEHRSQPRFHAAMILLDQVVKYFDERTFVTVLHGYEARRGGDAIPPTQYVI